MMLSRTGRDSTPLSVAGQTDEGRQAPWGCAAGAPYQGTASPPPPEPESTGSTQYTHNLLHALRPLCPNQWVLSPKTGGGRIGKLCAPPWLLLAGRWGRCASAW